MLDMIFNVGDGLCGSTGADWGSFRLCLVRPGLSIGARGCVRCERLGAARRRQSSVGAGAAAGAGRPAGSGRSASRPGRPSIAAAGVGSSRLSAPAPTQSAAPHTTAPMDTAHCTSYMHVASRTTKTMWGQSK